MVYRQLKISAVIIPLPDQMILPGDFVFPEKVCHSVPDTLFGTLCVIMAH